MDLCKENDIPEEQSLTGGGTRALDVPEENNRTVLVTCFGTREDNNVKQKKCSLVITNDAAGESGVQAYRLSQQHSLHLEDPAC